ncbi:hypothetical protein IV494_08600 [Kaistella sp. G5-32]|uniref:Methylamine utilisation protein MauE domain-containing protein n=1 Tax=Kaistella gelatinilytica TaxID=2787636 RepID=A0ABS0FBZ4_9FLAO|nr:MauE/DoxX family redox-associated membrane protein [Kaistella gelatinilytica]MBF8457241.1 hypothetical protein [Kaistella gelatinilytica]
MKSIFKRTVTVLAYFFVVVFIYATVQKVFDFETFSNQLNVAPQLGSYGAMVASLIVILQVLIVVLFCWRKSRFFGFSITVVMLGIFSIYMAVILLQKTLPCECLGIIKGLNWKQNFAFTLFLLLIGVMGLLGSAQERKKK